MAWRRHPKKDIEAALRVAEAAGWTVEEIRRGHRWGITRCPVGEHTAAVWSTHRDPSTLGKRIRQQIANCRTGRPGGNAVIHSFAAVIDGVDLISPNGAHADALYEAGCDDALLTSSAGVQRAIFDREGRSFAAAVASAIAAIKTSIPGARVVTAERLNPAGTSPLPHSV